MITAAIRFADLPRRQAGVILADPPWHFATYSANGRWKSAQYPFLSVEQIADLPVHELCAADSLPLLWVTQTHLPAALQVMAAWRFDYKTAGTWAKRTSTGKRWQFGTGYLLRSAAEFFLVGTRGHPAQLSHSSRNLIVAPVREHSRKPDETYALIETTWPGPYVELFARHQRPGWVQWGEVQPALNVQFRLQPRESTHDRR